MIFKLYDPLLVQREEDGVVYVKLGVGRTEEYVKLVAVNPLDGEVLPAGNILTLNSQGVKLHHSVNDRLGFNLDAANSVRIRRG